MTETTNGVIKSIEKKERKRKKKYDSHKSFIRKCLKRELPDFSIERDTLVILNDFIDAQLALITNKASELAKHNGSVTLAPKHVASSLDIIYPSGMSEFLKTCANESKTKYIATIPVKEEAVV